MMDSRKGITLIALIITIIVLLILVGVSISIMVGDNGVLIQAQNASIKTEDEKAKEEVSMAWESIYSDYMVDAAANSGVDRDDYFTTTNLNKYINDTGTITKSIENGDDTLTVEYQTNDKGTTYIFTIETNGEVVSGGRYGTKVDLGTVTVKDTALKKGWRYFYNDGTNIYLIYESYLESAQIPDGTNIAKLGYNIKSSGTRDNLINYLNGTDVYGGTWDEFATGVQNALNTKGIIVSGLTATGSPTVRMFRDSYDESYPDEKFEVSNDSAVTGALVEGYAYRKGETGSWGTSVSLANLNKAFFSETAAVKEEGSSSMTYSFWLARSCDLV